MARSTDRDRYTGDALVERTGTSPLGLRPILAWRMKVAVFRYREKQPSALRQYNWPEWARTNFGFGSFCDP